MMLSEIVYLLSRFIVVDTTHLNMMRYVTGLGGGL